MWHMLLTGRNQIHHEALSTDSRWLHTALVLPVSTRRQSTGWLPVTREKRHDNHTFPIFRLCLSVLHWRAWFSPRSPATAPIHHPPPPSLNVIISLHASFSLRVPTGDLSSTSPHFHPPPSSYFLLPPCIMKCPPTLCHLSDKMCK